MKIFKELKKLGYKHYTEHTAEELDNLPLESKERIMDQALVLRWFREKHNLQAEIVFSEKPDRFYYYIGNMVTGDMDRGDDMSYEEAEQACINKLIEICKSK